LARGEGIQFDATGTRNPSGRPWRKWWGFSLSSDGRSLAFVMGKTVTEVWALENFLPAPSAKK